MKNTLKAKIILKYNLLKFKMKVLMLNKKKTKINF